MLQPIKQDILLLLTLLLFYVVLLHWYFVHVLSVLDSFSARSSFCGYKSCAIYKEKLSPSVHFKSGRFVLSRSVKTWAVNLFGSRMFFCSARICNMLCISVTKL